MKLQWNLTTTLHRERMSQPYLWKLLPVKVDSAKILYQSGRGNVEILKINGTMWMLLDRNDSAETQPAGPRLGLLWLSPWPSLTVSGGAWAPRTELAMDTWTLAKVGHAGRERRTDPRAQLSLHKTHKLAQVSCFCFGKLHRCKFHPLVLETRRQCGGAAAQLGQKETCCPQRAHPAQVKRKLPSWDLYLGLCRGMCIGYIMPFAKI